MGIDIPKTLADLPTSSPRWVGRPMERVEDPGLVTGEVEFIDNVQRPGMLHCAILRSPHAHARIKRIDVSEAEKLPGVVAIITGEDARRWSNPFMVAPEGWGGYCLAVEKVRFVGEPVAAVAATSRYLAEDALELIKVEYEPLPPALDPFAAMEPGSPLVFEDKGTNIMFQRTFKWGEVDSAFQEADHVFTERFRWHRMGSNPMETFGIISQWHPVEESVTTQGSIQAPLFTGQGAAMALGLPATKVRVIGHPHGGSFGSKGNPRGIIITTLLSRKAGGRPVKWIEDRMEYLTAGTSQAWDRYYQCWLAVKKDGTVTAFKVQLVDDIGATAENFALVQDIRPLSCFTGCYAIPTAEYEVTAVATNKLPQQVYRGAGVAPHNFVIEQMMDIAARGLGMDPAEFRRRNFIPPDRFPYTIPSGNEYDSGNYEGALNKLLEMADYPRLRQEQATAVAEGRLVGIGVVSTIEPGTFSWGLYSLIGPIGGTTVPEAATVAIDIFGKVVARVGFPLEGQGQYTFVTQLLADYFGVKPEDVRVVTQDSLSTPVTFGPGGSRQAVALTGAILGAAGLLKEKLVKVAAPLLQANPADVELMDGKLRVKGVPEAALPLAEVVGVMLMRADLLPPDVDPNPEATYVWTAPGRTMPDEQGRCKSYLTAANACHLAVVEVDPETKQVQILKYCVVHDCGTQLNPAIVEGIVQGGIAQGVGAALLEEYVYDEKGQPLTATFMDYLLPTIHEVPMTEKAALVTPSPFTPLGTKGIGEGAILTAPAAITCAINDALAHLGIRLTEVPATPERLWRLMKTAERPS